MDTVVNARILKRFLLEMSSDPGISISDEVLLTYQPLFKALDYVKNLAGDILNLQQLDNDVKQWHILRDILQSGCQFGEGKPPVLKGINENNLQRRIDFWRRDKQLSHLPQCDYYQRTTESTLSLSLDDLIKNSQKKLQSLIRSFVRPEMNINVSNPSDIYRLISILESKFKKAQKENNPIAEDLRKRLTIAHDLKKLNELSVLNIPDEKNVNTKYCTLAESAGGVTEKISLIRLDKATEQLRNLCNSSFDSIDDYLSNHYEYKLSTEAILKLPKHGDIREVQKEAVALNISRLLGLNTAHSTMLSHQGQPALFIPFDHIKLIKEFARGKVMTKLITMSLEHQTYEHYSTINPVGAGLQPNLFIDDFGNALGLSYATNDTDAIGGRKNNKGLINSRSLYIFDQVTQTSECLELDSRLSMQPCGLIMKHTRHGQGRNRTLIEDSSFCAKFDSLMNLIQQRKMLLQYIERTIHLHQARIKQLNVIMAQDLPAQEHKKFAQEHKQVSILLDDMKLIRRAVKDRIAKIHEILPAHSETISSIEIRQALILEKLLNNPVLYSDIGRPYRNPWTYRHNLKVSKIEHYNDDMVAISFDGKVPQPIKAFIERRGSVLLAGRGSRQLLISRTDLASLTESLLHPEYVPKLQAGQNYLDRADLLVISEAYDKGHRDRIIERIDSYQKVMASPSVDIITKLEIMTATAEDIKNHIQTANNKGFGMHVLKKLQFDIQQQLRRMASFPDLVNDAFSAAVQLDRIEEFNNVLKQAVLKNKTGSPALTQFFKDCITNARFAANHCEAVAQSQLVAELAKETIAQLTLNPMAPLLQNKAKRPAPASISAPDLLAEDGVVKSPNKQPKLIKDPEVTPADETMPETRILNR
ncbi:hypothetical protein ACFORL_02275 [Legionella dresdenensis]|uniref:Coiled-coil protein n=1 Tax=Legionella dresdenensis TaxID=450200 RepID=A0ABV8CC70_9GAMM